MIEHINSLAGGWWSWMAPMLWQTALLAGFVWALDLLLRRRGWPQVRYALWLLVFARLLVPPTFALPTSLSARVLALRGTAAVAVQSNAMPRPTAAAFELPEVPPVHRATVGNLSAVPAAIRAVPRVPLSLRAWTMLASTAVSLFFLAWLLVRILRLQRLARRAMQETPVPAAIADAMAQHAAQLGLRRLPRLAMTDSVPSAAVCGIFRPILFLPPACRDLPQEQLGHILLHELAHLKRRDLPVNAAQSVLHILYWFNPVLWLAGRRLRNLREICCDATVANLLRERTHEYCLTLVSVADRMSAVKFGPGLGLLGLFESPSRLRQRIECLERPAWKHRRLRWLAAAGAAAAVVLFIVPMAAVKAESPPAKDTKPKATYEDMLKLCADADKMRMPTPEEIRVLGALWPQVPPEENAAYYFLRAASAVAPKEAIPDGSASSDKSYAGNVAAFQKWVELNQPAFRLMRQGFEQKTCRFPIVFPRDNTQPIPDLTFLASVRHLARTSTDAGFLAELQGKPDAAADAYEDCLRLGAPIRWQGVLIEHLVGIAVCRIGQRALDLLMANSTLSEEALKKVIVRCREAEVGADEPARMWEKEWAYGEAAMNLRKDAREAAVVFEMWRKQRDAATGIVAKKTLTELLQQKTMREISGMGANQSGQVQDPGMPALERAFEELGRTDVQLKETEIRVAISLYRKKHGGALPESLDALCPDILPAVPMDPFSGKPMRYAKTPEGWKLWSVGADNADNGGQGDPAWDKVWDGPDYVFISNLPSNLEQRSRPKGTTAPAAPAAAPAPSGTAAPAAQDKKNINAQVARLNLETARQEDVLAIFGEPVSYIWGKKTFSKDKLPDPYIMFYSRAFEVVMVQGRIEELRFEAESDYVFGGGLRWGSTLEKALKVMGPPDETVEGGQIGFAEGVLYKNAAIRENGGKGVSYYSRRNLGVRIFAMNDAVTALYVTRKTPLLRAPESTRHFVRIVQGKDEMTFEGKKATWDELPSLLEKVPDRPHTVLEIAFASDQLTLAEANAANGRASQLARRFGFEYDSQIGLHPLGSKAGDESPVAPSSPPAADDKVKAELMGRVEEVFLHNYRDISARKTIEWGDVTTDEKGNRSIRYKYLATIWDKDKMIGNEIYTFDAQGKFVSVKKVEGFPQKYAPEPADTGTQAGLEKLVEKFFSQNFRDITAREVIEWGPREALSDGNLSIRYKYNATIRDKDHQVMNQVFTFDPKGEFVSVKNVAGFPKPKE